MRTYLVACKDTLLALRGYYPSLRLNTVLIAATPLPAFERLCFRKLNVPWFNHSIERLLLPMMPTGNNAGNGPWVVLLDCVILLLQYHWLMIPAYLLLLNHRLLKHVIVLHHSLSWGHIWVRYRVFREIKGLMKRNGLLIGQLFKRLWLWNLMPFPLQPSFWLLKAF